MSSDSGPPSLQRRLRAEGAFAVVSPHLDDAVLSCGHLLSENPGAHVVTVFSAGPSSVRPLPEWDAASGCFRPGDDVMALRAVEDDRALGLLDARPHRLGFWDVQYRQPPERYGRLGGWRRRSRRSRTRDAQLVAAVGGALESLVAELPLRTWIVPLGLWHADHKCAARACLELAGRWPDRHWVVYEELPYRLEVPDEAEAARHAIDSAGFLCRSTELAPGESRKAAALQRYASQIPCLGDRLEAATSSAEVYHELLPAGRPLTTSR